MSMQAPAVQRLVAARKLRGHRDRLKSRGAYRCFLPVFVWMHEKHGNGTSGTPLGVI
ncbi:hypothetical protein ACE15N_15585 [Xanthomonas campestris pv. passiflorae]|uniref:hypothetical protein n=1 Tax=Xanthomonas campestris TaxID=339 RepID=UPI0024271D49|nr:hypothetical protein [Xanthomonas campestris]MBV6815364.1 hypothetical protein [Xanthomonas campestris pv. passiflorae]